MRAKLIIKLIYIALIAIPSVSFANPRSYIAEFMSSNWKSSSSALSCELVHDIPEYGKIQFMQNAGFSEQAELHLLYGRSMAYTRADIEFKAPTWQKELQSKSGWKFPLDKPGKPIAFSARQSRRILDALDLGLLPTIVHRDNSNLVEQVQAVISTVRFNTAYMNYLECQKNLVPFSFEDLRSSDIFFSTGSTRLDDFSIEKLGYILEYLADPSIRRIELSGYTDSVGSFRANHKLASVRVERVQNYLLGKGISEQLMRLKVYGEQRAEGNNKTPEGRSLNRRVNLHIYR